MSRIKQPVNIVIKKSHIIGLSVLALGALFRVTAVTKIPANTVGVYYSALSGVKDTTLSSGYHVKLPFMDTIHLLSTQVQSSVLENITTQTNDAQYLNSNLDIKWRVSSANAMRVFTDFKTIENLNETGIKPLVQRSIEEVTVNFNIVEVLGSKRNEVYEQFEKTLASKLNMFGVELVSVTITDTDAGDEIESAIKNEAVKQKEVDAAKQEKEKAQLDAEAAVIRAKGQAEANDVLSKSITENLIRMKEMEARMEHGWVEVKTSGDVLTTQP